MGSWCWALERNLQIKRSVWKVLTSLSRIIKQLYKNKTKIETLVGCVWNN